jgi:hypothetical protein
MKKIIRYSTNVKNQFGLKKLIITLFCVR